MVTQVLIIHGLLPFAITLKQTLERGAPFEAHPFTSVEAAVEYLRDHVQDVALVDFALPDVPGDEIVQLLREVQPNLAIIVTPRQNDDLLHTLKLQASIKSDFVARDLVSLINAYFAQNQRPTYVAPKNLTTGLLGRLQTRQHEPPPTRPIPAAGPSSLPPD
ncbi:MAG: response regulator, partial [Chloroflexota bacterium]